MAVQALIPCPGIWVRIWCVAMLVKTRWMAAQAQTRCKAALVLTLPVTPMQMRGLLLLSGMGWALRGRRRGDVLSGIEALIGSAFNDKLTGSGAGDMLSGGEGRRPLMGERRQRYARWRCR